MKSPNLNLQFMIILLIQRFLCTELKDKTVTEESVKHDTENQTSFIKADTLVYKEDNVDKTNKGSGFYLSTNLIGDDSWYSIEAIEDDNSSSSNSVQSISWPSTSSGENDSHSSKRSTRGVSCSSTSSSKDYSSSSTSSSEDDSSSSASLNKDFCYFTKSYNCGRPRYSNNSKEDPFYFTKSYYCGCYRYSTSLSEDDFGSSTSSNEDDSICSDHSKEDDLCYANQLKENALCPANHSKEDVLDSSDHLKENALCSANHSNKDDSSSSNHSVESIFCSYKNLIKDDSICSDHSKEDVLDSSDHSKENALCSANHSNKDDSSSSESSINNDNEDLELVKEYSFERSTIVYLMEILEKCVKEFTAVDFSYDNIKLSRFLVNSINLIDAFIKVFSNKKNDSTAILKKKVRKITSNFNSLDNAILEINKIIDGVLVHNKKSKLNKMVKSLRKLKKRFGNVKKEFEKHKKRWSQVRASNFTINIEVFNDYKKNLMDEKELIVIKDKEINKNQIRNLKSILLANMIEKFERFYKYLKSEHGLWTVDFNILNHLLNW